jgi:para-aminobenzoate synthetase component 1
LQRNKISVSLAPGEAKEIKQRMLDWSKQFGIFLFLDSNNYKQAYSSYECLLAVGMMEAVGSTANDPLFALQRMHDKHRDWLFGHTCYDYKNKLEHKLSSLHEAKLGFPLLHFFVPRTVCYIDVAQTTLTIESFSDAQEILDAIKAANTHSHGTALPKLGFNSRFDKGSYVGVIEQLREHIAAGDCYEINFCNEGYCENANIVPGDVFTALNAVSPAPFAAYYRLDDMYMMCASPERYLRKEGDRILSQPIKGTARRDADMIKDEAIKQALRNDIKERAENVMIVDLVRNDLSRCCETGSIQADELFGIYSFPQVHQMISTVSGQLRPDVPFTDAIRYSFPMGSMTGAPKYKVMQLIEQYERSRRELFSGTVGYISPKGGFDFNVIIRSLFYNSTSKYLSYQTGGAITYDSKPENEWEEMRLKAWAMEKIFA